MSIKRLKLLSKPPVTQTKPVRYVSVNAKPVTLSPGFRIVKKGPSNLSVNSVSSDAKPKIKRTFVLKTLGAAAKTEELKRKAEAKNAIRRTQQNEAETPLASLADLEKYVRVQRVTLPHGSQREWPVISPTAAADPLLTTPVTVGRWLKAGLLPNPVLESGRTLCYHLEELRSICQILGDHLTETKHYRSSHTETKLKLFRENARIREALFETAP